MPEREVEFAAGSDVLFEYTATTSVFDFTATEEQFFFHLDGKTLIYIQRGAGGSPIGAASAGGGIFGAPASSSPPA